MAVDPRRMQQLRGIAADWTSNNPTLLSGEIGIETDTGKFKIGPGAWNSLDYFAAAWDDVTGKPSTFTPATHTHPQSDITSLVSDLAGKASTSHSHAASDITSGTVATTRLGSGTASSSTYLRGDQTWATVSGGGGADRGELFDVRDYGALTGLANEDANTEAFQDCMDAIEAAGGGTMYIPATGLADSYYLRRPIWTGFDNLAIMGEGTHATLLTSYGPAFVTAKHPTKWECAVTTYTDVDTSSTVTVKTDGVVTNRSRYRMDLSRFISGGDMAPGGGRPALGISISPNGHFGLRTRSGVMGGRYPQASLATGENHGGSNFFTQWPNFDNIEWNFVFYQHETTLVGGIAGVGSVKLPDPWMLWGDGANYVFDLALTDQDNIQRTWVRCKFPQPGDVGLHRITIQFDSAASTNADMIKCSVDRVRKTVTLNNFSDSTAYYHPMNTANSSVDLTDLRTKWNRVGKWHGEDFTICNEAGEVGTRDNLEITSGWTDYSVLLVSAHKAFKHTFGSIGATITKAGGSPADDSAVWVWTSGADNDATAIGWMANDVYSSWSPADTVDDINLKAFSRGRLTVWGYMHPKGTGHAVHTTSKNYHISNLAFRSQDNHQNSNALLIGAVLNLNLENLWFKDGFYWSLAMMRQRVSYPLRMRNMRFSKGVHISDCSIWAQNWVFDYACNCAILNTSAELTLRDLYGLKFDGLATGIIRCHHITELAAGLDIEKGLFNIEGDGITGPNGPAVYYQKVYNHPDNRIILRDVNFGAPSGPMIYVDDTMPQSPATVKVRCEHVGLGNGNTILTARGSAVYGEVEVTPYSYLDDVNEYLATYGNGLTWPQFAAVKTVDKQSFGIPPCGAFVERMHEVHVKRPAEGAPSKWTITNGGSNAQVIQNHVSTTWIPIEFNGSNRYQHALSANFVPSLYCEATIPWPTASTTTVDISGASVGMARQMLSTLLCGSTAPTRSTMSLRWGVGYNSHITTGLVDNNFFSADSLTNSSYWASAGATAQREKRSNANITVTGNNASDWTVKVRRRWSFGLHLGTSGTELFVAGRTNKVLPTAWYGMLGNTYTLASGDLRIGLQGGTSGWTNTIAHQILDWMMGGSFPAGIPSTLYFGLSKTAVVLGSPTATEPGSGAYARVGKARNTTNFGETGDSGYIFSNKAAIAFPSPVGADWGLLTWLVVYDASTSGNIIAAAPLNRPVYVRDGDQAPTFLPGAIQFSL